MDISFQSDSLVSVVDATGKLRLIDLNLDPEVRWMRPQLPEAKQVSVSPDTSHVALQFEDGDMEGLKDMERRVCQVEVS